MSRANVSIHVDDTDKFDVTYNNRLVDPPEYWTISSTSHDLWTLFLPESALEELQYAISVALDEQRERTQDHTQELLAARQEASK